MSGGEKSRRLGGWGEELAARFLEERGWQILARNWRCRYGEVDLIASDGRYLAFVEVKLRNSDRYGQPMEAVTAAKQRRLLTAAQLYLAEHPTTLQPRFDVAQVFAPGGMEPGLARIEYVENAFEGE